MPLGLLLGQIGAAEQYAESFVAPFLFVMLFGAFINIPLKDYRKAFSNIRFSITTALINYIWTPVLVWILGKLFYPIRPLCKLALSC